MWGLRAACRSLELGNSRCVCVSWEKGIQYTGGRPSLVVFVSGKLRLEGAGVCCDLTWGKKGGGGGLVRGASTLSETSCHLQRDTDASDPA
jgi:hypothetical protein